MHIRRGDEVLVISGKNKGQRGRIKQALPKERRVVIEGLNVIVRHMRSRGPGKPGGRVEMEAPLDASNVMLICPICHRASRTGKRFLDELDHKGRPRKVRYCKACDADIPEPKE